MNRQDLFTEIKQTIADVVDDVDADFINEATEAKDIEGWTASSMSVF